MSNNKPDLSGHWAEPYTPNMAVKGNVLDPQTRQPLTFPHMGEPLTDAAANATGNAGRTYDLPYTEWGLKEWKAYDPVKNGDYAGSCLPFGMSRNINSPHGSQIIQNPDALAFLWEQNTWFAWVPTNPTLVTKLPYDTRRDMTPISLLAAFPLALLGLIIAGALGGIAQSLLPHTQNVQCQTVQREYGHAVLLALPVVCVAAPPVRRFVTAPHSTSVRMPSPIISVCMPRSCL